MLPDTINGKLTLKLRDVPWDQALDIVLTARNLGVEESDGVLTVYDLPPTFGCGYRTRKPLSPSELEERMSRPPLVKKVFTPKHIPISAFTEALNKLKSEHGKIVAIGNDVYVEDKPDTIATMSQLFIRLDRATPQILIEVRIVEASPSLVKALELQWKGGQTESGQAVKNSEVNAEVESKAGIAYDFISKTKNLALSAQLSADPSDSRTISAPRIMATNDQKVSIKQGTQIPYRSGHRTVGPGCNAQFKEAVLELIVTPHIEEDGQTLTLDFQVIIDNQKLAETLLNLKEAGAKLSVEDGETIVIGGLIIDHQPDSEGRLDGEHRYSLSDLLNKDRQNKDKEMLIFVTAHGPYNTLQ